jgi:hypothetical protein
MKGRTALLITAAIFVAACTYYHKHLRGGDPIRTIVNTTVRNVQWELDDDVPEDVFDGYEVRFCEKVGCSMFIAPLNTVYVRSGPGWTDRLRHELVHLILYEANYHGNHHAWMGRHNFCYGSPNCNDLYFDPTDTE